jgi:DNA-directed RNA polymerase subunit RPC12/RpoP
MTTFDPADHNPDKNPNWRPNVARRVYRCAKCGAETVTQTNHTGTVWSERCRGTCRTILHPHTARERVFPFDGPHRYVCEEAERGEIVKREVSRFNPTGEPYGSAPGELVTTRDETQWFHAYTGAAPVKITAANRAGLRIG